eukprot:4752929-Amphidinium_carterae.1
MSGSVAKAQSTESSAASWLIGCIIRLGSSFKPAPNETTSESKCTRDIRTLWPCGSSGADLSKLSAVRLL